MYNHKKRAVYESLDISVWEFRRQVRGRRVSDARDKFAGVRRPRDPLPGTTFTVIRTPPPPRVCRRRDAAAAPALAKPQPVTSSRRISRNR